MASQDYASGPFSAIFAGAFGAGVPLTQIDLTSTGNFELVENCPMEWVQATGSYEQSGARTMSLSLALMSNDETAIKLARGLALSASDPFGTPTGAQYVIVLVDGTPGGDQNYYIPCCQASSINLSIVRGKSVQSQTPLQFGYTDPDMDTLLFTNGTLTEIGVLLGAQDPF